MPRSPFKKRRFGLIPILWMLQLITALVICFQIYRLDVRLVKLDAPRAIELRAVGPGKVVGFCATESQIETLRRDAESARESEDAANHSAGACPLQRVPGDGPNS